MFTGGVTRAPAPSPQWDPPLVSGEAVELDVRVARLGSRALALLLDIAAQVTALLILLAGAVLALSQLTGLVDSALVETVLRVLVIVVLLAYPTLVETFTNGRSLGKLAVGLRVVREDGGPIRLRHAFTRALIGLAVEWPGLLMPPLTWVVCLLTMIFSGRGRRLGDVAAGTLVIHVRPPQGWGHVPAMPPALAAWATRLDLAGIDDRLALAARNYLARVPQLREPYRTRLGEQLAADVLGRATPPPPGGTPAWAYLAAVLAERHRRAALRHTGPTPDGPSGTGWRLPAGGPTPDPATQPAASGVVAT